MSSCRECGVLFISESFTVSNGRVDGAGSFLSANVPLSARAEIIGIQVLAWKCLMLGGGQHLY